MNDAEVFTRVAAGVRARSISTADLDEDVVCVEVEVVDFVIGLGGADGAVCGLDEGLPVKAAEDVEVPGVIRAIRLATGCLGLFLVGTISFCHHKAERPLAREWSGVRDDMERMKSRGDALMQFPVFFLALIAAVHDSLAARARAKFTCGRWSATVVAVILGIYLWH